MVAGGTGALGAALVGVLLQDGYRVCVPWYDRHEMESLRAEEAAAITDERLRLSPCNVADPDQLAALLDVLTADWGPLWLAASAVGGWSGGTPLAELDDLTLLDRMFMLNVRTAAAVAREGLRHMHAAGGRVVLVGAAAAGRPAAGEAAYTAAKAGVLAMVGTLARELRGTGRTANAVVPTIIDTPSNRAAMPDANHERWPSPLAIARVMAWLASADAWVVNGASVPVPGDV